MKAKIKWNALKKSNKNVMVKCREENSIIKNSVKDILKARSFIQKTRRNIKKFFFLIYDLISAMNDKRTKEKTHINTHTHNIHTLLMNKKNKFNADVDGIKGVDNISLERYLE